jgi:hypothetical protein
MYYIKFLSIQKHSCSQVLDDTAPFFGNNLLSWNIKPHMKLHTYLPHNLQNNESSQIPLQKINASGNFLSYSYTSDTPINCDKTNVKTHCNSSLTLCWQ